MIGPMNQAFGADRVVFRLVNRAWTSPLLDRAMPALSISGDLAVVRLLLLGSIAAFGKKTGRKVALALGFASSELLKEITMRPFLALPDARLLIPEPSSYAFPSGHATDAFAASGAVLAVRRLLGRVPLLGWGMLAVAGAIAYSRIYVGVHWPTDVAAGIALGALSGRVGTRLALRRWRREKTVAQTGETQGGRRGSESRISAGEATRT